MFGSRRIRSSNRGFVRGGKLAPKVAAYYMARGIAFRKNEDYTMHRLADFDQAIKLRTQQRVVSRGTQQRLGREARASPAQLTRTVRGHQAGSQHRCFVCGSRHRASAGTSNMPGLEDFDQFIRLIRTHGVGYSTQPGFAPLALTRRSVTERRRSLWLPEAASSPAGNRRLPWVCLAAACAEVGTSGQPPNGSRVLSSCRRPTTVSRCNIASAGSIREEAALPRAPGD